MDWVGGFGRGESRLEGGRSWLKMPAATGLEPERALVSTTAQRLCFLPRSIATIRPPAS